MTKVVLDTNVFISAIVFGGNPRKVLNLAIEGRIRVAVSKPIIEEIKEVLAGDKFKYPGSMIRFIIGELEAVSEYVEPLEKIDIIEKDPDDNRILECAVEAEADFIVSGDRHLLDLERYKEIKIVNPSDFLEEILKDQKISFH